MSRRVLVADDDELHRWSLVERLGADGYDTIEAGTAAEALDRADAGIDLFLLDSKLRDDDGLSVFTKLRALDPDVLVILLTGPQNSERGADAMKAGAFDYVTRPFDLEDVALRVARAMETGRLRRELRTQSTSLARPYGLDAIVGESETMHRVKALVRKIATTPGSTVLITGERGTGKDLIARVIHYASRRAPRAFLKIRCSALSADQLECDLFGQERGAFADAGRPARGLFEQADEGTVFIDDVGELTAALQARLLRFLEEKTFRRVGGSTDIRVDVRLVSASDQDLEEQVRQGKFRDDLYYRLNVLRVELPPLRSRGSDIPQLAAHFVDAFARDFKRPVRSLSGSAVDALKAYGWPGNVRELRNAVERAVLLSDGEALEAADFESWQTTRAVPSDGHGGFSLPAEGVSLEDVERSLVAQALERAGGNQTRAAALLGLHRDQIRYRIEKFGLGKKG